MVIAFWILVGAAGIAGFAAIATGKILLEWLWRAALTAAAAAIVKVHGG